jgi:tetratricopeptide (TPR) repeat protein
MSVAAGWRGDFKASRKYGEQALAIYRRVNEPLGIANTLNDLGILASFMGEIQEAHDLYRENLVKWRELGDTFGIANGLNNLGLVVYDLGDHAEALHLGREAAKLYQEVGDLASRSMAMGLWGRAELAVGEVENAHIRLTEALESALDLQALPIALEMTPGIAELLLQYGQVREAALILLSVLENGAADPATETRSKALLAEWQTRFDVEAYAALEQKGRSLSFETYARQALEILQAQNQEKPEKTRNRLNAWAINASLPHLTAGNVQPVLY